MQASDSIEVSTSPSWATLKWRSKSFRCQLRGNYSPHNDHLLLASLCAFTPFFAKNRDIVFDLPVSSRMRNFIQSTNVRNLKLSDDTVEEHAGEVCGLSYSAGVDSTAAAYILQNGTAVYLQHKEGTYRSFAIRAIMALRRFGMKAFTVHCDVQSIRRPYGFPVDVACAIPCILNASSLNLDSIAFGTVLESAYNIGRGRFVDYATSSHYLHWGGLFQAAGLPFNQVTAGLSEVATWNIKELSGLPGKSCLRSSAECKRCYKCYRRHCIRGEEMPVTRQLRKFINGRHHFNVLEYAFYKHGIKHFTANKPVKEMGFLERWYGEAATLLPSKYAATIGARIESLVGLMDEEDKALLHAYNS